MSSYFHLFIYIAVKNIVLTGFGHITLLDLDTIDLSNLNRQFLFKKKDVKQSKALVSHCSFFICPLFIYTDCTSQNLGGRVLTDVLKWNNGSSIFVFLGGREDGCGVQPQRPHPTHPREHQRAPVRRGMVQEIRYRPQRARQPRYVVTPFFPRLISATISIDFWYECVGIDARRHVNKMCVAADVPLVESGTAGYLGQVQPILKVCIYVIRPLAPTTSSSF